MSAPLLNFSDMDMCQELDMEIWSDVTGYQVNDYLAKSLPFMHVVNYFNLPNLGPIRQKVRRP